MLALTFVIALAVSLAATPVVIAIARRTKHVAAPSPDRWHVKPTALFGGVAIAAGYTAALAVPGLREAVTGWVQQLRVSEAPAAGIIASGLMMFVAGIADDLFRLRPPTKLVLQAAAAAILMSFGAVLTVTPWAPANLVLTLFWFIAVTNALNLLDNMDGVSSGVTTISAIGFAAVFAGSGEFMLAALALALAGGTAGFLAFNFRPAKIFMGDSGSLLLGASLAGLSAAYTLTAESRSLAVVVPLLLLAVPIADTALVVYTRTTARHPIAVGGRDHIAHRLVNGGLSETMVALLLYLLAATGALAAAYIANAPNGSAPWWAAGAFGVLVVMLGAYVTRFHSYPESERRGGLAWFLIEDLLYRRRLLEVLLDMVLFASAYWGAYLLRWDGLPPPAQWTALLTTIGFAVTAKSVAFMVAGVYRGVWEQVSVADVHRLIRAAILGSVLTVGTIILLYPELPVARSIFILDFILVVLLAFVVRLTFRSLDRLRHRIAPQGKPTLIYGAGVGGDLTVRELIANPRLGLLPVGFLDDDPRKVGLTVHGLPVHSADGDLEALLRAKGVHRVVIGARQLGDAQIERLANACRPADVEILALRVDLVVPSAAPAQNLDALGKWSAPKIVA